METAKLRTVETGVSETADRSENIIFCSTFTCSLGRHMIPLRMDNKTFTFRAKEREQKCGALR